MTKEFKDRVQRRASSDVFADECVCQFVIKREGGVRAEEGKA